MLHCLPGGECISEKFLRLQCGESSGKPDMGAGRGCNSTALFMATIPKQLARVHRAAAAGAVQPIHSRPLLNSTELGQGAVNLLISKEDKVRPETKGQTLNAVLLHSFAHFS